MSSNVRSMSEHWDTILHTIYFDACVFMCISIDVSMSFLAIIFEDAAQDARLTWLELRSLAIVCSLVARHVHCRKFFFSIWWARSVVKLYEHDFAIAFLDVYDAAKSELEKQEFTEIYQLYDLLVCSITIWWHWKQCWILANMEQPAKLIWPQ